MCDMPHSYVRRDSFIHVTIHIYDQIDILVQKTASWYNEGDIKDIVNEGDRKDNMNEGDRKDNMIVQGLAFLSNPTMPLFFLSPIYTIYIHFHHSRYVHFYHCTMTTTSLYSDLSFLSCTQTHRTSHCSQCTMASKFTVQSRHCH